MQLIILLLFSQYYLKHLHLLEDQQDEHKIYQEFFVKPRKNTSTVQTHYYNVYDDKLIDKVSKLYKDDIEIFNFKFES